MSKQKIKGKCGCGKYVYLMRAWQKLWDEFWDSEVHYCPYCGYYLGDDGYAYEMVRAERVAELERAYWLMATVLAEISGGCPEELWDDVPWDCATECNNNDGIEARCFQRYFLHKAREELANEPPDCPAGERTG